MVNGILQSLKQAENNVAAEISVNASCDKIAAGSSAEGFAGGYQAALRDINGALRGYPPTDSRYWPSHG